MKRRLYLALVMDNKLNDYLEQLSKYKKQFSYSLEEQLVSVFLIFRHCQFLFIYVETQNDRFSLEWPMALQPNLERWPSIHQTGTAIELIDIYHDNQPIEGKPWRMKEPEQRVAKMARLNPEHVGSYIYYHYQKQEEKPGSFNQTYIIGAYGRYMFSYHEVPATKGDTRPGRLSTNLTPDNWHEVMQPHFEPWDYLEEETLWQPMDLEFCYIADE